MPAYGPAALSRGVRRQYRGRGRVHRGRGAGGNGVDVPAAGSLPGEGRLAAAFGIAVIVSPAWGAVGWTGTVLKSAAVTIAVMLLWTTIVQVQVDYYATMMPKLRVPSTTCCPAPPSTSSRCCSAGQPRGPSGAAGEVASRLAFAILAAYTLACLLRAPGHRDPPARHPLLSGARPALGCAQGRKARQHLDHPAATCQPITLQRP